MIQENSSNRQENIVAGDNSQLQFLSAVEEFKRAETDEEKAVAHRSNAYSGKHGK